MNPIIKWAGGKEKELAYIKENVPNKIERYIEPFVPVPSMCPTKLFNVLLSLPSFIGAFKLILGIDNCH